MKARADVFDGRDVREPTAARVDDRMDGGDDRVAIGAGRRVLVRVDAFDTRDVRELTIRPRRARPPGAIGTEREREAVP